MPGFLNSTPVSDEQRRANDVHRPRVVVAVLAVVAVYAYLFTFAADLVGLPAPQELAAAFGVTDDHVFDRHGLVRSGVTITFARQLGTTGGELLVYYVALITAFLLAYFLPLRFKQPSLAWCSILALALLYGARGTAGLLCAHTLSYLVYHPQRRRAVILLPGLLAGLAFPGPGSGFASQVAWMLALSVGVAAAYLFALRPLLGLPRLAIWLRNVVAQSALITITLFALIEGISGSEYRLPLGILLFFWQWSRLILYQIDYRDGLVPPDTPLGRYLAVFFSPGAIPSWDWGVELGLGYSYCNNMFLREDKNRTILSGVRILWVALGYLLLGDWARTLLADGIEALGVELFDSRIYDMVDHFVTGGEVTAASVLLTSLMDTLRWTIWFVGILHFKTGVWRICGYRFEPYFNRPWLATNLVVFWSRYTYYYREFLLQVFYYPVFFRFFKKHPRTRLVVAIFAAAGAGNLIWGHLTERMYDYGMTADQLGYILRTWPYYLLLGGGIALTALYLLERSRKKRRRPWSRGPRLVLDVLAVYCTFQYFALIHILSRSSSGATEWDLFRLLLRAFGITIP